MLRIALLVMAMTVVIHMPDVAGNALYKDALVVVLLSLLVKPWLTRSF